MIPVKLELSGFLSYYRPQTLDFTTFDLACISGPNGAGKSSLLDAITWALFGKARRSDEGIIHIYSDAALVEFIFEYEGTLYRVLRAKHRQRPTRLEFQVQTNGQWRPLTENTLRATQKKIETLLHMNYETFVQASFFLQGKADRFAQQTPAKRKDVLAQILGLEIWDVYLERTREEKRRLLARREALSRQLERLEAELAQEDTWKQRLEATETDLAWIQKDLEDTEALLRHWQSREAELQSQKAAVEQLRQAWEEARHQWQALERRYQERLAERQALQEQLIQEPQWREALRQWEEARKALAHWEALAQQARTWQQKRQELEARLAQERIRLQTRLQALEEKRAQIQKRREAWQRLQEQRKTWASRFQNLHTRWENLQKAEEALAQCRQDLETAMTALERARGLKEALEARRTTLQQTTGGRCPVCAQPLPQDHRESLLQHLEDEARALEEQERHWQERVKALQARRQELEAQWREAQQVKIQLERLQAQGQMLEDRLRETELELQRWEEQDEPEWQALRQALEQETFAPELRQALQEVNAHLEALGYDEQAHQATREAEARGQEIQKKIRMLEQWKTRLEAIEEELRHLEQEKSRWKTRAQERERSYQEARSQLETLTQDLPDLTRLQERALHLREQLARLQEQRGALRQRLELLSRYRQEAQDIRGTLEETGVLLVRYQALEEAFGRNGVPALLIEQALPQLEEETNRLLEQLTEGEMRIMFRTQRALRHREGVRETLDILVSDRYGQRDYETFSGGEAFRINFAIRLALARFLARRAGARLQFLVIDEGFGSQDQVGRQRLVEAIQAVRTEFAKILVITHLEDLKERFPVRIEVEKGPEGSRLRVVT